MSYKSSTDYIVLVGNICSPRKFNLKNVMNAFTLIGLQTLKKLTVRIAKAEEKIKCKADRWRRRSSFHYANVSVEFKGEINGP
jgi:hypothetical protein